MKGVTPDIDYDCESPRSFVSALSDLDRAAGALKAADSGARSPRRSSMDVLDAVAEDLQMKGSGAQRLQLSPTATMLLRQARIALMGEPLSPSQRD